MTTTSNDNYCDRCDTDLDEEGHAANCPDYEPETLECLDGGYSGHDGCAGTVEYRWPGYGQRNWPRCDRHANERIDREMELRRRYLVEPPADWSPDDAAVR